MHYFPAIHFTDKLVKSDYTLAADGSLMPKPKDETPSSVFGKEFWTDLSRLSFELPEGASPTYSSQTENFSDNSAIQEKIRQELLKSIGEKTLVTLEDHYKQSMINEAIFLVSHELTTDKAPEALITARANALEKKASLYFVDDETYGLKTQCILAYQIVQGDDIGKIIPIPGVIYHDFTIDSTHQTMRFDSISASNSVLADMIMGNPISLTQSSREESIQTAENEENVLSLRARTVSDASSQAASPAPSTTTFFSCTTEPASSQTREHRARGMHENDPDTKHIADAAVPR
jgi:hypothetical protein